MSVALLAAKRVDVDHKTGERRTVYFTRIPVDGAVASSSWKRHGPECLLLGTTFLCTERAYDRTSKLP
jgi:hypothetical protein